MRCSQAVIQDGKRRELGLLSLEEEEGAKGTLGLFAAPVWKGVERWSRALLTGAWWLGRGSRHRLHPRDGQ